MARKVIRVEVAGKPKGKVLYEVTLSDGTVATTLEKFEVGDLATAWFDDKWHKIKLVRAK